MSGNIITASNLVVAGNIAVGGFLVQGTSISQGNVNVRSITISGYQIEVSGTTINFSGADLTRLTVCGAPIGGWVGTAATNLNMSGYRILNVERLECVEQDTFQVVAPGSTNIVFTNICDDTGGNRITILPSDNFIGIGQPTPNAGECIHAVPPVIFEGSLAVGTPTLSGALNVLGDVYVEGSVYTSSQSVYVGGVKLSATSANELSISGGLIVTSISGTQQNVVGNVVYANIADLTISAGGVSYQTGDVVAIDANVNTMPFFNNIAQQLVVTNIDGGAVTELSLSGRAYYSNKEGCFAEVTTSALTGTGTGLILAFNSFFTEQFDAAPRVSRQQPLVQNGRATLANGTATVKLPFLYGNNDYAVAITPLQDNSGFFLNSIGHNQFTITAANTDNTESWLFRWATFGIVEFED